MSALGDFSRELSGLAAKASPAVVGVEHRRGQGSGLVLAPDGIVLTNAHVTQGPGTLRVRLSGSEEVKAEILGRDERTDLAVLRIPAKDLPTLPLAESKSLAVGQLVIAI